MKCRNLLLSYNLRATSVCGVVKNPKADRPVCGTDGDSGLCGCLRWRRPSNPSHIVSLLTLLSTDRNHVRKCGATTSFDLPRKNTWMESKIDLFKWWVQKSINKSYNCCFNRLHGSLSLIQNSTTCCQFSINLFSKWPRSLLPLSPLPPDSPRHPRRQFSTISVYFVSQRAEIK